MSYPTGPWVPPPNSIPEELRTAPRWVRWKLKAEPGKMKPPKVPLTVGSALTASSTDPTTWGTFATAHKNAAKRPSCGIGFVLGRNGTKSYIGVDLDHVRDVETGELAPEAVAIIERCATYAEVSPSGTGVKLIGTVPVEPKPDLPRNKADLDDGGELEVYAHGRYFTVTGQRVPGSPTGLGDLSEALPWLVEKYLSRGPQDDAGSTTTGTPDPDDVDAPEELVRRAQAYLRKLDPAVSGQGGHDATWKAALAVVRGFGLSTGQAMKLLLEEFNPRCSPPWSERDLLHKVRQARTNATVPWGYLADKVKDAGPSEATPAEGQAPPKAAPVPLLLDLPSAVALNVQRNPIPTGVVPFDHDLDGGIDIDESIVIGGAPGTFKTSMLASIVPHLARPDTAVLFVASDEPANRVGRKIGTRFGEAWTELCADYPSVLDRLRKKLADRDTFIRITHPGASFNVEEVLDAFDAQAPRERRRIVLLDHLHSVSVRGARQDDTEKVEVERVVDVLIDGYVRTKGWSLIALSEVTKAALSKVLVTDSPMAAFAGTRKIVSRFDAAFVMVPDKGRRVRVLVAKNRFGPKTPFTLEVDVEFWTLRHVPEDELEHAEDLAAEEQRQRRDREADERVLAAIDELALRRDRKTGRPVPVSFSDVRAKAGGSKEKVRVAVDRLKAAGVIESWDPVAEGVIPAPPHTRPEYLRRATS